MSHVTYFSASRTEEDHAMILAGLGYIFDAGHWRLPTRAECEASGFWRIGDGKGGLGTVDEILASLKLVRQDNEPF